MGDKFVATKLFIKGKYGFQVASSYEDMEASDENHFSLVVFRCYRDDGRWSVTETHPLKEREVIEEEPDVDVGHRKGDTRSRYKAGPFRVEVAELEVGEFTPSLQTSEVLKMTLTDVEFEVDDEGFATSSALRERKEKERLDAEKAAEAEASFRKEFHIDEDGHVYPRDLHRRLRQ